MPDRYAGHKLPAIMYAQPFEFAVATVLLLFGIAITVSPIFVPASIATLSFPWTILFRALIILAGLFMFAGFARGKHKWSYTAEMSGMVMGATVFLTYAAGLFGSGNPAAVLGGSTNLAIGLACIIKWRALWIEAHARLQLIRELPMPDDLAETDGGA